MGIFPEKWSEYPTYIPDPKLQEEADGTHARRRADSLITPNALVKFFNLISLYKDCIANDKLFPVRNSELFVQSHPVLPVINSLNSQ